MAKSSYSGPADALERYAGLVGSIGGMEVKGAANPYTSRHGYMTSFVDKEGVVSIRLGRELLDGFIRDYETDHPVSYGAVMKDFAVLPPQVWEDDDLATRWLARAHEFAGTLKPNK